MERFRISDPRHHPGKNTNTKTPVGLEISTVRNHPDTNSSFYLEATFASIGFKFPKRDAYPSPFRTRNKAARQDCGDSHRVLVHGCRL